MPFVDRRDGGRQLALALLELHEFNCVILGLSRGGVPVAFEVARTLCAPLDVMVVRKLGVPYQSELAMGAVGEGGVLVVNDSVVRAAGVARKDLLGVAARERKQVELQVRRFRSDRPKVPLQGRHALIVDDGVATGVTAVLACQVARAQGASRVTLAVPVCAQDSAARLRRSADEVVCLEQPAPFYSVGQWYADFTQTSDDEVLDLLSRQTWVLGTPDVAEDPDQLDNP